MDRYSFDETEKYCLESDVYKFKQTQGKGEIETSQKNNAC